MTVPFGVLLDLIAIDQIKRGELEAKPTEEEETEEFLRLMFGGRKGGGSK